MTPEHHINATLSRSYWPGKPIRREWPLKRVRQLLGDACGLAGLIALFVAAFYIKEGFGL